MNGLDKLLLDKYQKRLIIHKEFYHGLLSNLDFDEEIHGTYDFILAIVHQLDEMKKIKRLYVGGFEIFTKKIKERCQSTC